MLIMIIVVINTVLLPYDRPLTFFLFEFEAMILFLIFKFFLKKNLMTVGNAVSIFFDNHHFFKISIFIFIFFNSHHL